MQGWLGVHHACLRVQEFSHHVVHVSNSLKVNVSTDISSANGMKAMHLSPKVMMLIKITG